MMDNANGIPFTLVYILLIIVGLVMAVAVHFLPTAIAVFRGHHQWGAIAALNLLLGWTGIFWIVALIWSLTAKRSGR
jgi:hypothetical protein